MNAVVYSIFTLTWEVKCKFIYFKEIFGIIQTMDSEIMKLCKHGGNKIHKTDRKLKLARRLKVIVKQIEIIFHCLSRKCRD